MRAHHLMDEMKRPVDLDGDAVSPVQDVDTEAIKDARFDFMVPAERLQSAAHLVLHFAHSDRLRGRRFLEALREVRRRWGDLQL